MRVKARLFSGAVCEQVVYNVRDGRGPLKEAKPRLRFKDAEERRQHRERINRQRFIWRVNANFGPSSLYATLTFDDENEVHSWREAKRLRDNFYKRLRRINPECRMVMVMGRGKKTDRIHLHMISEGLTEEEILKAWGMGDVRRVVRLKEHNYYNGIDHGRDYTGLANYLYDHWTEEQGGHRWKGTRNLRQEERERPAEAVRVYSEERPPRAPKGYVLVESRATEYGYLYFKYVREPERVKRRASGAAQKEACEPEKVKPETERVKRRKK